MEQGAASMKIKSYFASSVEQAVQKARQELGTEAMLVTSRRAAAEARHLGAYEVVFGAPDTEESASPRLPSKELSAELQVLRAQLEDIKRVLQLNNARAQGSDPDIDELYRELTAADLGTLLARQITDQVATLWQALPGAQRSAAGIDLLHGLAEECIRKQLRIAALIDGKEQEGSRVLVFTGPPGSGKTTTLTKIAIQEFLARRVSVRIISMDPYRVAAHEKLRSFAGILGTGFTAASTMREFIEAVEEFRSRNVLLIDTPGYGGNDFEGARDLSGFLGRLNHKEVHLVLPASMKTQDMGRAVRRFEEFKPDCLLFTKLDETESFGAIISTAIEAAKPLSYFTNGQTIPEDLEAANLETLLEPLFTRERAGAISAA
jgi:flagellar biosynthesis protein FlhF